MDGISAAASIFALVQATEALGKTVKFLWSLRKVPDEIVSLRKELTEVETSMRQAELVIRNIEASGSGSSAASRDLSNTIQDRATELKEAAVELNTLCGRLRSPNASEDPAVNRGANESASTRQRVRQTINWVRERNSIKPIIDRIVLAEHRLSGSLQSFTTVHSLNQARLLSDMQQSISLVIRNTSQIGAHTAEIHNTFIEVLERGQRVDEFLAENDRHRQRPTERPSISLPSTLLESSSALSQNKLDVVSPSLYHYRQYTLQRRTCLFFSCRCQCHISTVWGTGRWRATRALLGSVSLRENLMSRAPCNVESCNRPASTLRFNYSPPQWLLSRQLFLAASWGGLAGHGASLHLRVPICMSDALELECRSAAMQNDLQWFQRAITKKRIFPNQVIYGYNIIERLMQFEIDARSIMLLFNQGFPLRASDLDDPAHSISGWIRNPNTTFFSNYGSLALLAAAEEQIEISPFHDYALGLIPTSLDSLLADSYDRSDLNSLDVNGLAPIHYACCYGNNDRLQKLLQCPECEIDKLNRNGQTVLHCAAQHGDAESVRLILDHGSNILDVNQPCGEGELEGMTPLGFALFNPAVVRLLLDRGANVAIDTPWGSSTPLIDNITNHFYDDSTMLLEDFIESFHLLLEAGIDLECRNMYGATALSLAAQHRLSAVHVLAIYGCRADVIDDYGSNILHHFAAAITYDEEDGYDLLEALGIEDVDPDARNVGGKTPMDIWQSKYAYRAGDFEELLDEIRELRASHRADGNTTLEEVSSDDEEESDDDSFEDAVETL